MICEKLIGVTGANRLISGSKWGARLMLREAQLDR